MIEQQASPKYNAILVHGYWMSEHKSGLSLRSRLATRAAARAYNLGQGAEKIVVDLGHLWGEDNPSEGSLIANELTRKYHVPEEAIILREDAYSTGGEVKSAIELARQNNWTNVLDIAFEQHQSTIPQIYEEYEGKDLLNMQSVEQILQKQDKRHVANLTRRLGKSKFELVFKYIYMPAVRLRMLMPGFSYDTLEQTNKNYRTGKGPDSPISRALGRLFDFDVYTLSGKRSPFS